MALTLYAHPFSSNGRKTPIALSTSSDLDSS
jgi:hypothetical protein